MNRANVRIGWLAGAWLAFAVLAALFFSPAARAQSSDLALSSPPDLERFLGRTVTRVEVVLDDDTWSDVGVPTVSVVKHGEGFTPEVARRAMAEVLATGGYARGRVSVASDGGAGVRIIVHVVARKLIESLTIDAHGAAIEQDELTRASDLTEGGEIVGVNLAAQKKNLVDLLVRHGYPSAEVAITTRATDDPQRVLVLIDAQPGPPRLLAKRVFYISDRELGSLEQVVESSYAVGKNERADEPNLDAADTKLEALLRARGYHHADVSHDVIVWQGQVTLRVRVDTGPLFFPRFEGNDHYDHTALSAALDLAGEADRSAGHLVQKLKDFYAKRGYLDAEVSMDTRGGDKDRVHLLVFTIHEHPRVVVTTRAYPCLREDDIKRLREGGPSSASAIGNEIDSFLEEELPGADLVRDPDPQSLDRTIGPGAGDIATGARPVPLDLEPNATFVADTYERAVAHVQELYRNEGFLHAQVGPVQIVRRRCSPRSPPGQCSPITPTIAPAEMCTYDATNLPLPVQPIDPAFSCVPDPIHGVECDTRIELRIPVKLGPRTQLYDVTFTGATAYSEQRLADAAQAGLGNPVNTLRLDDARRRILDLYKEGGYAYADVKYTLDSSVDHTRARARFEIVEGDQVIVREIIVRGNRLTHEATIRRRIALEVGQPYRASDIRKTQERIATLNVFSSVTVGLADPYVPQKNKAVIVTVVENVPQVVGLEGGFTTGEGFYGGLEYGHRNLGGVAIGFSLRGRLSYLPDFALRLVNSDPQVLTNFTSLTIDQRIAGRVTASLIFPEIGLGPLVRTQLDAVFVHDLQRDFYITKLAFIPSAQYRPIRELLFTLGQSFEDNYVKIFQFDSTKAYLDSFPGGAPPDLAKYLLMPDGASFALAQRFIVAWDRRDDSFNASRGTYLISGVEHVDSYPVYKKADNVTTFEGHFLRFTETFAGYIPLPRGIRIAAELRFGSNVQLTETSQTYPDRLFFMGGPDSMRGWALRSFVPQDDIDQIRNDSGKPACVPKSANAPPGTSCMGDATGMPNPDKFTLASQAIRGGNLMINPRLELRVPVRSPLELALFTDVGNLWRKASYPFESGKFPLRASVGAGVRVQTPVGPLALDYGVNVTRDSVYAQEDFGALHFAIGLY